MKRASIVGDGASSEVSKKRIAPSSSFAEGKQGVPRTQSNTSTTASEQPALDHPRRLMKPPAGARAQRPPDRLFFRRSPVRELRGPAGFVRLYQADRRRPEQGAVHRLHQVAKQSPALSEAGHDGRPVERHQTGPVAKPVRHGGVRISHKDLRIVPITFGSMNCRRRIESSPPIVETIPSIIGSANAAIRSSARARGFRSSHSGSRRVCLVSVTVTPNACSNCRLPAA